MAVCGAFALGGGGLLLGWEWGLAGFALGILAGCIGYPVVVAFTLPDPEALLRTGRPREALERIEQRLPSSRITARKWPGVFREVLAFDLLMKSEALQELNKVPQALDTIDEAVAIYRQLMAANPARRFASNLADALYQQASLLGTLSRHGEALGAVEVAIGLYRDLAVLNRGEYLPALADALTRQADELGYLDRIDEARAAADAATLIRSDMLPAGQLRRAGLRPRQLHRKPVRGHCQVLSCMVDHSQAAASFGRPDGCGSHPVITGWLPHPSEQGSKIRIADAT